MFIITDSAVGLPMNLNKTVNHRAHRDHSQQWTLLREENRGRVKPWLIVMEDEISIPSLFFLCELCGFARLTAFSRMEDPAQRQQRMIAIRFGPSDADVFQCVNRGRESSTHEQKIVFGSTSLQY